MAKYNAVNYNLIYVYSIADDAHKGLLKIGKTSFYSGKSVVQLFPMCPELNIHAHKRIQEQTKTALVDYQLEYTELAVMTVIMDDGSKQYSNFEDKDVHEVLYKSGFSAQKFVSAEFAVLI